jgi:beta-galactosidase
LKLTPDKKTLKANGEDLSYVLIEAYDKEGNLCPLVDNTIDINVKGTIKIANVDNGNPHSFEPFQSNEVSLFYGKAMLILESEFEKGTVKITTSIKGLKSDTILIHIED